jgi:hypothetical protein
LEPCIGSWDARISLRPPCAGHLGVTLCASSKDHKRGRLAIRGDGRLRVMPHFVSRKRRRPKPHQLRSTGRSSRVNRVRVCDKEVGGGLRSKALLPIIRPKNTRQFALAQHFDQCVGLAVARSWGFESPLPHHTSNPAQYRGFSSLGAIFVHRLSTNTKALGSPREAARLWSARFVVAAGSHLSYDVGFVANPLGPLRSVAGAKRYFRDRGRQYYRPERDAPRSTGHVGGSCSKRGPVMKRALSHNFEAERAILVHMIRRPMMKRGLPVPQENRNIFSPSA